MSLHPSLRTGKSDSHKSVLTRLERFLHLKKDDKWTEESTVLGIPKVRIIKLKIKKKPKAEEVPTEEAAAAAAGAEEKAAAPSDKAAAPAKKEGEKK